jgi:hypothetical protein
MMAMVEDMGALPGNKHKLRIITVTGTGVFNFDGDFGDTEQYRYEHNVDFDCEGNWIYSNAPQVFEAKLGFHYNPPPAINCRWFFHGIADSVIFLYSDYQLNDPLTNYLDYKIFAAYEGVAAFDSLTECLVYNYNGSGIHEMQFYYDYLKELIDDWVNSAQNTSNRVFSSSKILGKDIEDIEGLRDIFHEPKVLFRKRDQVCTVPAIPPAR